LDGFVGISSSDESFYIINGSGGVLNTLIFGSLTDQSFFVSEGDYGGSNSVSEFVGDDFDVGVFIDSDTGVSCS